MNLILVNFEKLKKNIFIDLKKPRLTQDTLRLLRTFLVT